MTTSDSRQGRLQVRLGTVGDSGITVLHGVVCSQTAVLSWDNASGFVESASAAQGEPTNQQTLRQSRGSLVSAGEQKK
ncbi:hypothetical protein NL676_017625 [Syzygium grande]|nr:hypothetical protein NL676_017625 [Syzygium grande]